jgi:hypothetical protein
MKKPLIILTLLCATILQAQNSSFTFNWNLLKNDTQIPQREAIWLKENVSKQERDKAIQLVSALSKPEASQLLTSYFYMDGSYRSSINKKYLDSFAIRPPEGKAGIIRVAYLVSRLRHENFEILKTNKVYKDKFTKNQLNIPAYKEKQINKKINLKFDYRPANIILELLSNPKVSYQEIIKKTNLHQFKKMIDHRNQSFYKLPLNKELLATCLQVAASNKPIHKLYRYANPYGLLNFSDVKNNIEAYKNVMNNLSKNEKEIFNYINANISPLLPNKAKFDRKVSFFFMNGSDGWASGDVTGLDLNYYKDDYKTLLNVLMHETYHTGQNATSLNIKSNKKEPYKSFESTLSYLFGEGTASYLAPPKILSTSENKLKIKQGIELIQSYFENTIKMYDAKNARKIRDKGIAGGGPFYWLGAEMSRVIVQEYSSKKLASIIPYNGVKFFQTYFNAIKKSKKNKNLFSKEFTEYINSL